MASICPSSGRKKNWMPRLACSLVRVVWEVGCRTPTAESKPIGLVNAPWRRYRPDDGRWGSQSTRRWAQ